MSKISKKQRILFLVHVEDQFRYSFPDSMYIRRLQRAMGIYDRVIVLVSGIMNDHTIPELSNTGYGFTEWSWSWGYEREMFHEKEEKNWVIETSSPHQWTWVPPELRHSSDYANYEIYVGGGCRNECLQDFVDVLQYVGIPHHIVDGYVF